MKSTVAIALVASFVPFVLASPYHMVKHAERDSVQYEVDYVTDVQVATVYEQVTQYWTGEPAATETVTYSAPETTSAAQTTESAHQRQHGAHSHSSSVEYTIEKTTTPEPAPTTTSTVVAPVPTTTSTVAPAPEPTTTSIVVVVAPTLPTVVIPTTQAPVFTVAALPTTTSSTPVETPAASTSSGLVAGPADATALPVYTVSGYVATGTDSWSAANMQAGILQITNEMRAKWGASPVVWDDDLASQAQTTIKGCAAYTEHAGQNTAGGSPGFSPTDLVNTWSSEAAQWESGSRDGFTDSTGHFTQLVWKATTKIGCAAILCGDWRTLLCNYNPAGNVGDASQNSYVDSEGRTGSYAMNVDSIPVY